MTWKYRLGRLPEYQHGICSQVTSDEKGSNVCGKPAPYRLRATLGDDGVPNDKMRCANCAAGAAYRLGLAFPPGLWRD